MSAHAQALDILPAALSAYAEAHTSPESPLLAQLNRHAWAKVLQPVMLSGHMQGRILAMFSQMIRPTYVLEIGTYVGYSALCMAEGLAEGGELHSIDVDEEHLATAQSFIDQSPLAPRIHLHCGPALELIPLLNKPWDMVFIDADKMNYKNYYELVVPLVRKGGWIMSDNVLWKGKVTEAENAAKDKDLANMLAYNQHVASDARVETLLLPVRDGILIAKKK